VKCLTQLKEFKLRIAAHALLYEWIADFERTDHVHTMERSRWNGKQHLIECYRYLNQVPLRDSDDALMLKGTP
jgi:hypothetical protein